MKGWKGRGWMEVDGGGWRWMEGGLDGEEGGGRMDR